MAHPPAATLDKRGETIRDMFADVAPRYDLLNRLLSARLDVVWRRRLARELALAPGARVLDLCCGTGDQALALARRGAQVAAGDFCLPMLALARRKYRRAGRRGAPSAPPPSGLAADALALPFPAAGFDAATVSFGLRNVADLGAALGELARVVRPGGALGVLEFAVPEAPVLRGLYLFYFRRLLPAIGRLVSRHGTAYSYLPSSVLEFPQRRGFVARLEAAGFEGAQFTALSGGIVCLYRAVRR
jgi:demethylmenaquinone methyltransferase/2-methoxy-6-polyprenyl-1,4-benzoquinol methylase